MNDAKHNEQDIAEAIAAIHRFAMANHRNLPLDAAVKLLEEELRYPNMQANLTTKPRYDNLRWLVGKGSSRVEAMLDWLAITGKLSKKELRRVRRIRLLVENNKGQIKFNHHVFSTVSATWILGLICLIFGIHIGWLIFSNEIDLERVIQSFGIGMALGSVASMVLDRSFRFAKSRSKIEQLAPWLAVKSN